MSGDLPIKEALSKVLHEGTTEDPAIANDVEHLQSMLTVDQYSEMLDTKLPVEQHPSGANG